MKGQGRAQRGPQAPALAASPRFCQLRLESVWKLEIPGRRRGEFRRACDPDSM